ncbi:MAG: type II toxin-antitoxin system VapC family toxin [Candidatus Njordarchaeales archaeon]
MTTIFIDTNAFFKAKEIFVRLIKERNQLVTSTIVIYEFIKITEELIFNERNEARKKLYIRLKQRFPILLKELEISVLSHLLKNNDIIDAYNVMSEKDIDIGDALIYILMKKKGIKKILTFDNDWTRLDVEIINH